MEKERESQGFVRWDGKINLMTVISVAGLLCAAVIGWSQNEFTNKAQSETIQEVKARVARVEEIEQTLSATIATQAKISEIQQRAIDRHETAIEELQSRKEKQ